MAFADWSANSTNVIGTPEMAELLVSLYEQERLRGWIGDAYESASLAWSAAGKEWTARRYAALAVQHESYSSRRKGRKEDNDMTGLLRDAKTHWSWNTGVRRET